MKEKIEIRDSDINVSQGKPAKEWMNEIRYKVLGELIDYTYNLNIKPSYQNIAEKLKINRRKVIGCIKKLREEGLVQDGKDAGSIKIRGYYLCRQGYHVCDFCGEEMKFEKEWVTKNDYIKRKFTCPTCNGSAEFKIKGKRENG